MKHLTAEQQGIIEDSLWVVNTALQRQGLSHSVDLKQQAVLYMCTCLLRFEPSKNVKWTTFAYKNVYLYLKKAVAKEKHRQSLEKSEDLLELCESSVVRAPFLDNLVVEEVFARCSGEEKSVLQLKMQGYTYGEISSLLKCSVSRAKYLMSSIRKRIKPIMSSQCD